MNDPKTIRIMLADDHAMFREGVKEVLSRIQDFSVVAEAGATSEIIDAAKRVRCDVIVLDIGMPGRGGIDVLKELRQIDPRLHILILSMFPEDQYAYRAIKAGASGYLTKNKASEELIEAVRRVASGRKYISAEVAEQLAIDLERDTEKPLHARLGDREYQVLCMIASGKTVQQIARELALSVSTVSTMRVRILKKFAMKTNAELTHYAIKESLVS
ncbi:MAG TPA: response regulator transcription factor [Bacteroidota bacterium]|nr:response regulator transcription factor [Bacteroidota bacterium]